MASFSTAKQGPDAAGEADPEEIVTLSGDVSRLTAQKVGDIQSSRRK